MPPKGARLVHRPPQKWWGQDSAWVAGCMMRNEKQPVPESQQTLRKLDRDARIEGCTGVTGCAWRMQHRGAWLGGAPQKRRISARGQWRCDDGFPNFAGGMVRAATCWVGAPTNSGLNPRSHCIVSVTQYLPVPEPPSRRAISRQKAFMASSHSGSPPPLSACHRTPCLNC